MEKDRTWYGEANIPSCPFPLVQEMFVRNQTRLTIRPSEIITLCGHDVTCANLLGFALVLEGLLFCLV
jgi:hypothetical protein